jgi:hypothetical protein
MLAIGCAKLTNQERHYTMTSEMVIPPVLKPPVQKLRYTDSKGFSRLLVGSSRQELEKALEAFIIEGKATLVGAVFYEINE